jgi:hypothetical protein
LCACVQSGALFVAAPAPAPAPPGAAGALHARASPEATPAAWRCAQLRFGTPPPDAPPPLLLAAHWRLAPHAHHGPCALLALRGVPPPPSEPGAASAVATAAAAASSSSSSFALVPLLDAWQPSDTSPADAAARLCRYQRAAAVLAPHALAADACAACCAPCDDDGDDDKDDEDTAAAGAESDAAAAPAEPPAVALLLALRDGRLLRLRRGATLVEAMLAEGGAATRLIHFPSTAAGGGAVLALLQDWRASASLRCARTLRGGAVAAGVATAAMAHDAAGRSSVLLLPRPDAEEEKEDDAAAALAAALQPLRGPGVPRGTRTLCVASALAALSPSPLPACAAAGAAAAAAGDGMTSFAHALRVRADAAAAELADEAERLEDKANAAAAAQALIAECAAAAASAPASSSSSSPLEVALTAPLRGRFAHGEWVVIADVALRGGSAADDGCDAMDTDGGGAALALCDVALALLPCGGGAPLAGRATRCALLRSGSTVTAAAAAPASTSLLAAAPAAAVASAAPDGVWVLLTAALRRPDGGGRAPFAQILGRIAPKWINDSAATAAADDADADADDVTLHALCARADLLLTSPDGGAGATDVRGVARALCTSLPLAPVAAADDAADDAASGGTLMLRPVGAGASSRLPPGCAVALRCASERAAELSLSAPDAPSLALLRRCVAAALPRGLAAAPHAGAPPALAAAQALCDAMRAEVAAALALLESGGEGGTHGAVAARRGVAALSADTDAACAAMLRATSARE